MQLQLMTIQNAANWHSSFVYQPIVPKNRPEVKNPRRRWFEVKIVPRANGRPVCSGCDQPRLGYDRLPPRRFSYLPLWGPTHQNRREIEHFHRRTPSLFCKTRRIRETHCKTAGKTEMF